MQGPPPEVEAPSSENIVEVFLDDGSIHRYNSVHVHESGLWIIAKNYEPLEVDFLRAEEVLTMRVANG